MKKLILKIYNYFSKPKDYYLEAYTAIRIVNILKAVINSPISNVIITLTKTKADDAILLKAKMLCFSLTKDLLIFNKVISGAENNYSLMLKLQGYLSSLSNDEKELFYITLSGQLTQALSDGKLSLRESIILTQKLFIK